MAHLRKRCLRLGPASLVIALCAWVAAGIIFPVALGTVKELDFEFYLHFVASQTLCGLIAVSYPQFGITFLGVRTMYPALLTTSSLTAEDLAQLRLMDRLQGWCLVLAASVPMLAVGLLAALGGRIREVLGVLSALGVVGFAIAYVLVTAIRADRAALEELSAP